VRATQGSAAEEKAEAEAAAEDRPAAQPVPLARAWHPPVVVVAAVAAAAGGQTDARLARLQVTAIVVPAGVGSRRAPGLTRRHVMQQIVAIVVDLRTRDRAVCREKTTNRRARGLLTRMARSLCFRLLRYGTRAYGRLFARPR
jgi:hypothetical protein